MDRDEDDPAGTIFRVPPLQHSTARRTVRISSVGEGTTYSWVKNPKLYSIFTFLRFILFYITSPLQLHYVTVLHSYACLSNTHDTDTQCDVYIYLLRKFHLEFFITYFNYFALFYQFLY